MGNYGTTLPLTGAAAISIGGVSVGAPYWIAALGAGLVILGFGARRLARGKKARASL